MPSSTVDQVVTESVLRRVLNEFGVTLKNDLKKELKEELKEELTREIVTEITEIINDLTAHIDERFNKIEKRLDDHETDIAVHTTQINDLEAWHQRVIS